MNEPRNERDSELSHIYKEGGWPEPRRQIDQAILAASRRATRREHSFVRRWAPPFALAATVVLTFTLFLRVSEEKPDALISSPARDRQPAPPAEESPSAETPKPGATKSAPVPKSQAAPQTALAAESVATRKADPVRKPAAAPTPAPPQPFTPAPRLAPVERAAPANRAALVRPPAPTASALKEEAPETVRADRPEPAPVREAPPETPASLPPAPSRGIEPFAREPATGAASGASAVSDTAAGIVIRRSTLERSPQSWLEDILRLKAEGKTEEVGRELAEFRKRYPGYALPEDLR